MHITENGAELFTPQSPSIETEPQPSLAFNPRELRLGRCGNPQRSAVAQKRRGSSRRPADDGRMKLVYTWTSRRQRSSTGSARE